MARESCIEHRARERFFQIREDYMTITGNDPCAAAILHLFEFWTNAKLECVKPGQEAWIEGKTAKDIAGALFNLYNEKSVRQRLKKLKDLWLIDTRQPIKHRKSFDYLFVVESVQEALRTVRPKEATGKNTFGSTVKTPLDIEQANGKNTVGLTVKTPLGSTIFNGKNTVALYTRSSSKEKREEESLPLQEKELETNESQSPLSSQIDPQLSTQASNTTHETESSAALENHSQNSICDNNTSLNIDTKKQIEEMRWDWRKRPWRLSATDFKPEMIDAVFKSNPKPHEERGFGIKTDTGSVVPNERFIAKFLNSLEGKLSAFDVQALADLQGYWRMAQAINKADTRQETPVPNPTANASAITPEQARRAKEIIRRNARHHAS